MSLYLADFSRALAIAAGRLDCNVHKTIKITNELGHIASTKTQEKMIAAFVQSTQLEWIFWQSAYHQEQWLI